MSIHSPEATGAGTAAAIAAEARQYLATGELAGALTLLRRAWRRHPQLAVTLAECLLFFVDDATAIEEAVAALTAAEADDPGAGYLLAWLSLGGRALPLDLGAAGARLERAADAGHPLALRALALASARTAGDRSLELLERGVLAGDPIAGLLLAERWRRGAGGAAARPRLPDLEASLRAAGYPPLPPVDLVDPTAPRPQLEPLAALLSLPERRPLADAPRVDRIDRLLTDDECRFLIAMALPLLRRSTVHDPSSGAASPLPVRTSCDASFDLMHEDAAMRLVLLRLARAAGFDPAHAEPLIVLHYRPGEAYRPHRDYLAPNALAAMRPDAGQRRTTLCAYLNTPGDGGATSFPTLGVTSPAVAGSAVVFDNLSADGEPEPRSLHAGDPVRSGEKWLATIWFRERPVRSY